jgi:predicted nucleic acid-binding protein
VLDPGSVLVEALTDRSKSHPDELYVMEKLGDGTWRFLVVSADGAIDAAAVTALCHRCHAEAVADGLFGLPRRVGLDKNNRPDRKDLPGLGVQKEKTQTRR